MRYAARFGLPIVTFVDTPGAYPGLEAEEHGQSVAIAEAILAMTRLPVPIVTTVTGEGGSGGALALAAADRVLILDGSYYSVISPEGCATILFKDALAAPRAAAALRMTAPNLRAPRASSTRSSRSRRRARTPTRWRRPRTSRRASSTACARCSPCPPTSSWPTATSASAASADPGSSRSFRGGHPMTSIDGDGVQLDTEAFRSLCGEARDLITRLERSSVQRITLELGEARLQIERAMPAATAAAPPMAAAGAEPPGPVAIGAFNISPGARGASGAFAAITGDVDRRIPVLAPLVGTFYAASGPGEKPFVEVGQRVDVGDTVGIVEAMKLMNEVGRRGGRHRRRDRRRERRARRVRAGAHVPRAARRLATCSTRS